MNILLISSYLPFPLFSGGHIRLYNLIKQLSKKHSITLICEKRDYQGQGDIKELEKFCKKVIVVPRKKQWTFSNILKTGFSFSSFLVTGHTNEKLKEGIRKELNQNQFDLIHVETSYVMQNLPKVEIPLVLVEHNVEYLVYKRFVDNASWYLKPLLYLDILKLKYWEEKVWKNVTKLIAVSFEEKKIIEKIRKDVAIVSNGVDTAKFRPLNISSKEKTILFIGEFKWLQNRKAAEFILKEIWPKLKAEFIPQLSEKGVKLWIVGRNIPQYIKKLSNDSNVFFDQNAPKETEQIYHKSFLLLAPIKVGGGTSFKILESMSCGVPVVTTTLGNAVDAEDGSEIVVSNNPKEFVKNIIKLLDDKKFYNKISENGRKLVEKKYNWTKISNDLNSVYDSAVFK